MKLAGLVITICVGIFALTGLSMKPAESTKVSTTDIRVISFVENYDILDSSGAVSLDSLGKYLRCNEELFEKAYLVINPYNTKKEWQQNKNIGIERYRVVTELLGGKYKLDIRYNILYQESSFFPTDAECRRTGTGLYVTVGLR